MLYNYIIHLDKTLILSISNIQNIFLDYIFIFFTRLWDAWIIWILITIILLIIKKYRKYWIFISIALILNLIIWEWILKHIFMRERPFQELLEITIKINPPVTSSFPSWHSSASICFAVIFSYFFWNKSKVLSILVWIIALLIVFSRLYLQVHYPSDIIVGSLVWFISAFIILLLKNKS